MSAVRISQSLREDVIVWKVLIHIPDLDIPAAVSFPHFLDADPSLLENVDGLKPDREKHESYAILQQTIGLPLFFHSRMQTNLVMQRFRYNSKLAAFNDITVPLFWFDMYISKLPTYLVILLKLTLRILPIVQTVLMYLFGIIGVTTSVLSLVFIVRIFNQQQQQKQDIAKNRVPLIRVWPSRGSMDNTT